MCEQIDVFGNIAETRKEKHTYAVYGYQSYTQVMQEVDAVSEKQAVYFFRKSFDFRVKVLNAYRIK